MSAYRRDFEIYMTFLIKDNEELSEKSMKFGKKS